VDAKVPNGEGKPFPQQPAVRSRHGGGWVNTVRERERITVIRAASTASSSLRKRKHDPRRQTKKKGGELGVCSQLWQGLDIGGEDSGSKKPKDIILLTVKKKRNGPTARDRHVGTFLGLKGGRPKGDEGFAYCIAESRRSRQNALGAEERKNAALF